MRHNRVKLLIIVAGLAWIAVAGAVAGELEPPVPPGTPTMLPIDQIEARRPINVDMLPLTISEPGTSWYLVHDIKTTGAGITVAADDVTIDLNGFVLEGGTGVGIRHDKSTIPYPENVTIQDGTVRGWGQQGIRLGTRSSITRVRAISNGGTGIEVDTESLVIGSIASDNGTHGIMAFQGTVIRECVAGNNRENGFWGSTGVLIVQNVAEHNDRNGIRVDDSCHVQDNVARGNGLSVGNFSGIWVWGDRNRVEGNSLADNRNGITVDGIHNIVARNSATENWDSSYTINGAASFNMVGTIRTSLTSAGPWDNLCFGTCP